MSKRDDAVLLGVEQNAGQEELRAAFRTLAIKFHPDMAGEQSADHFMHIRQAYERLCEGHWDRVEPVVEPVVESPRASRAAGRNVRGTRQPRSDFLDIVKGAMDGLERAGPGRVIGQVEIEVPLDLLVFGAHIEILYPVYVLCRRCNGEGFLADSDGLVQRCRWCRGAGEQERELRVPVVVPAGSRDKDRLLVPLRSVNMPGSVLEVFLALERV